MKPKRKHKPAQIVAPQHRQGMLDERRKQIAGLTDAGKLHIYTPAEVRAYAQRLGARSANEATLVAAFDEAVDQE